MGQFSRLSKATARSLSRVWLKDPVLVSQFALARYDTSGNLDGGFGRAAK
jgi:hypothetical protein